MTSEENFFYSYEPDSNHGKVTVANGFFIPIIGKGSISVTPMITLESAIHVPKHRAIYSLSAS